MVSSSKSSNKTTSVNKTYDQKLAADNGANVVRAENGGFVNITDGGAIDEIGAVAMASFRSAEGLGELAASISDESLDLARDTLQAARSDQSAFFSQLITYAVPAIALIFIARSVYK